MSDPTAEPGAPSNGPPKIPAAAEKSISEKAQQNLPPKALSLAAGPDRVILRLNKLLSTPGGIASFLSTLNYSLYFLAYVDGKTASLQERVYQLVNRLASKPVAVPAAPIAAVSRFAALGALLSSTRTTLRLLGLFPLYAWLRQLLQGPKPGQDQILYAIALTQCLAYIGFQGLENIALLTDSRVISDSLTARWHAPTGSKTAKIYLTSYRFWLAGVLCDIVRLAREAQLAKIAKANRPSNLDVATRRQQFKDDKAAEQKWWSELIVPLAWAPFAAHCSVEGGFSWFNLGIMGACGGIAGLGKTSALWAQTA